MSRRYTDAELREILAKAVEDGSSESGAASAGLSLEEIKEIGAEVGIEAESLERAARSVVRPDARIWLAGGPTAVRVERRVRGELESAQASEVLSVIRSGMRKAGDLKESTSFLEWRSTGELGERVITLSSKDGVTTVTGIADLTQAAVVTHLPLTLLGLMGSGIGFMVSANAGNEIGMVCFAAVLPTVLFAARRLFARLSGSESRKLEHVVEELTEVVGERTRDRLS